MELAVPVVQYFPNFLFTDAQVSDNGRHKLVAHSLRVRVLAQVQVQVE